MSMNTFMNKHRLESLLSQARERSRKILIKQTTLDISVSAENRTNEVSVFDLFILPVIRWNPFLLYRYLCIYL
jgi:hypothetical protein